MFATLVDLWQHDAKVVEAFSEGIKHLKLARQGLDLFPVAFIGKGLHCGLLLLESFVLSRQLLVFILQLFHLLIHLCYLELGLLKVALEGRELIALLFELALKL